ncbi:cilia- and flagella-associated protein 45 [Rana temporaria]|uniref:cilia- and flagella-associated protein 45 n=1 Tax=Rana temporaria TaxID=8407 RepID=UPI001AAC6243|nr:cilia- and flagella-associated protein 45 [Rana temporaria]
MEETEFPVEVMSPWGEGKFAVAVTTSKQEKADQTGAWNTSDMPESLVGSVGSGSHASHRSKGRKYRMKALSSEIDESLFGTKRQPAKDDVQTTENRTRKTVSAPTKGTRGRKPETIQIITSDLIRDLVVPSEDPSGLSIIMSPYDFHRIKSASRVLTKTEREMAGQAYKEEKEAAILGVNERKNYMKQKEMLRKKNEKLSDLEEEAQQRAQYLLQRANTMRMEQEDEIKKLNEMILNAKCHAIRDAQTVERKVITKELEEETKRLDQMMEVARQKAIKMQEKIDELRKQERIRGKLHIIEQITDNEEARLLQEEQREQEAQQMLQYLEELQMEDYKDMEKRRNEQLVIQAEIKQINIENERKKIERKEQEKLADLQVLEYTKQKMAREAEYEAEQEKIKKEKEMEVARLRALQERAHDHRAEQDALRAKRNQEAMERSWRQKEKEEALKQVEVNVMLRKARLDQVAHKEHFLAVHAQRNRVEFERVLKVQRNMVEKDLKEQEEKTNQLRRHASELRRQVREQEQKQVVDRISHFEEGKRLAEEARQRRARLDDLKQKKLEELRNAGLPDKYCSMVARKAEVPITIVP